MAPVRSEIKHVGVVKVVVGDESVGDRMAYVLGTATMLEGRVPNLHPSIV
jgi:hypothetical protein